MILHVTVVSNIQDNIRKFNSLFGEFVNRIEDNTVILKVSNEASLHKIVDTIEDMACNDVECFVLCGAEVITLSSGDYRSFSIYEIEGFRSIIRNIRYDKVLGVYECNTEKELIRILVNRNGERFRFAIKQYIELAKIGEFDEVV